MVKKAKDPNAPKRPLSGYMLYSKDRRPGLAKEQPNLANTEIVSVIATEWSGMSDAEKAPYIKRGTAAKARYVKAKAAYDAKGGKAAAPKKTGAAKKVTKKVVKKVAPKKTVTKKVVKKVAPKKTVTKKV